MRSAAGGDLWSILTLVVVRNLRGPGGNWGGWVLAPMDARDNTWVLYTLGDSRNARKGRAAPKVTVELEECASRAVGGRPDAR